MVSDRALFNRQSVDIVLDIGVESFHVFLCGGDAQTGVACEHLHFEIVGKVAVVLVVDKITGKKSHTPCTTFTCCLHDRDRRVEGGCKNTLSNTRSLEKTTMTGDAVNLDFLVVEEDVVAYLQTCHSCVKICAHEVGKVEAVCNGTHEQRTTFSKTGDRLA